MTLRGWALGAAWKLAGLLFALAVVYDWFGAQQLVAAVFLDVSRLIAAVIAAVLRHSLPS